MYQNRTIQPRLIAVAIAAILLLIAFGIYSSQGNAYAPVTPAPSAKPLLTNPEVLKNWLPDSSYTYTIGRIDDYLTQSELTASTMKITGQVGTSGGAYSFTLQLLPSNQSLAILVTVNNYSPIISTAVSVNGTLQNPTFNPSQTTAYTGLTDLMNSGLTTTESNNLQTAFAKFAPNAQNIAIDSASITQIPPTPSNPDISYKFIVKIDKNTYNALIHCPDLDSVELILSQGSHQVFDSGMINGQS